VAEKPAPSPQMPRRAPLVRLEGTFAAANVATELPVHAGGSISAYWLRAPVTLGLSYAFFPGAPVDRPEASLLVTRHTVAALARASTRYGAWEIAGAAGPLVEVWIRTTRSALGADVSPSSTLAGAGAFGRASITLWPWPAVGVDAGLALELTPWAPHFRAPSGNDILAPNVARARGDVGLAFEFP
jgi:hypothetical protein